MSVNNANVIGVYVNGTKVAVATSHELSLSQDTIEVTTKDNAGEANYLPGKRDGTISVEGFLDPSNNEFSNLFSLLQQTVTLEVSDKVSGNQEYTGNGIITEITRSGENDSAETFSASIQLTSFITEAAIP